MQEVCQVIRYFIFLDEIGEPYGALVKPTSYKSCDFIERSIRHQSYKSQFLRQPIVLDEKLYRYCLERVLDIFWIAETRKAHISEP